MYVCVCVCVRVCVRVCACACVCVCTYVSDTLHRQIKITVGVNKKFTQHDCNIRLYYEYGTVKSYARFRASIVFTKLCNYATPQCMSFRNYEHSNTYITLSQLTELKLIC